MNITVYLGAYDGNDETIRERVQELGGWIGKNGHTLVYGGSKSGLMGLLAMSAVGQGGKVIGVEPQMFIDREFQYDDVTQLIVTKDMPERKAKMIELGEAYIAFPGGTGTLEEISEIMSRTSLKLSAGPCILYNIGGFYDDLKNLLNKMIEKDLSTPERQQGIYFVENLSDIVKLLQ